ncbi:hypothetical protein FJN14_12355 [Alteromonas mediterranea]|uniref:DUF6077 domain-containing protein n=1 Tax=Alteromonas mediterranea TaxID=314275 RepID=UPI001131E253|nr:DUF6077 domain-containing protein [Alteromonas mediterranea]QDG39200.1 hypothetical protein FJN14_12355 [Alteromonas mediterranea]
MNLPRVFSLSISIFFALILFVITFTSIALWVAQPLNFTFHQFSYAFILILPLSTWCAWRSRYALVTALQPISATKPYAAASPITPPLNAAFTAAALFIACLLFTLLNANSAFSYSWLLGALGCGVLLLKTTNSSVQQQEKGQFAPPPSMHTVGLCITSLSLIVLYLFSASTNADDTHFVSYVAGLLQHPNSVLFSQDVIFNESLPNHIFALNLGQSWELLIAFTASVTGANHLTLYYFAAPCLLLFFVPWVTYAFLRIFSEKHALLGTIVALVFLIFWSTNNHLHGYFFIPRFFQGKALLLMLFVPLVCTYTLLWCRTNQAQYLLLTGAAIVACGGVSSTGLYVAGLTAGICVLAFSPWRALPLLRNFCLLAIISVPNIVMLGVVKYNIDQTKAYAPVTIIESVLSEGNSAELSASPSPSTQVQRSIHSMYWLFGDHYSLVLILALLFGALIVTSASFREQNAFTLRWLGLIFILCFSHPLASFLANVSGLGNLIWRYHWSTPLSLVIGLSAIALLQNAKGFADFMSSRSMPAIKPALIYLPSALIGVVLCALLFLNAGLLKNKFGTSPMTIKVPTQAMLAASETTKLTSKNDTVLAQALVSQMLPMLPRDAALIASRPLYWEHPYFTKAEITFRRAVQAYTDNINTLTDQQLVAYRNMLLQANVTVVVTFPLSQKTTDALSLHEVSKAGGYNIYRISE